LHLQNYFNYICGTKIKNMKRTVSIVLAAIAGVSIVACGPSKEEIEAREQAKADSIAAVEKARADSIAAAEAAEKAKADSIAKADSARRADSIAKAEEAKKGSKKK